MNIELDYRWDKEEFLKASHANFRRRRRTIASRAFGLLIIFMIASSLLFVFEQGFDASYFIILFLAIYWFLLRWPLQSFFLARQFEKHAEKDTDIHWVISDEGFKGGSAGSQGEFAWDAVTGIERSQDGFLIYRYPIFHWLPMSAFQSRDDIDRFESVAKQTSNKYVPG